MILKLKADFILTHPEMSKLDEKQKTVLALEAEQHINGKCQAFMSDKFGGKDIVGIRVHLKEAEVIRCKKCDCIVTEALCYDCGSEHLNF